MNTVDNGNHLARENLGATAADKKTRGYAAGGVDSVLSVEQVARQAAAIAEDIPVAKLDALACNKPFVSLVNLRAGYGRMEILHHINLRVARAQSLCLIGPNGAGKSTVLHAIFGFNNIFSGEIFIGDGDGDDRLDVTALTPNEKLARAGIASTSAMSWCPVKSPSPAAATSCWRIQKWGRCF